MVRLMLTMVDSTLTMLSPEVSGENGG